MRIAQASVPGGRPDEAAGAIVQALGVPFYGAPDWIAVHHGAEAPAGPLRRALTEALGGAVAIHGGGSCLGVMNRDGAHIAEGDAVGAFAIWDRAGDFGSAAVPFADDPRAAGAAAARAAIRAAGRDGEAPDLVWMTAAPGCEERVLAGVADALGPTTPVVGGSAADNDVSGRWTVFDAAGETGAGVVLSALYPSAGVASAFQSGYAPTGPSGVATRAEGRTLFEIDGRPARAVYAEWTGGAVVRPEGPDAPILAESSWSPLGREVETVAGVPLHLLAHPALARADGGLDLFAEPRPGWRLHQMTGSPDSLATRAGRLARAVIEEEAIGGAPAGALVVFCGGSMLAMRDRMDVVAAGLRDALGDAPFLGVFTFGEQGWSPGAGSLHGNLMISCTAFGRL